MRKSIEQIQKLLDKQRPIRYNGDFKPKSETIKQFIVEVLENENYQADKEYYSIFADNNKTQPRAKLCFSRSLGDLYRLAKFYFKDVTLLQVQKSLSELLNENRVNASYCYDVKKMIYVYDNFPNDNIVIEEDEYGRSYEDILQTSEVYN